MVDHGGSMVNSVVSHWGVMNSMVSHWGVVDSMVSHWGSVDGMVGHRGSMNSMASMAAESCEGSELSVGVTSHQRDKGHKTEGLHDVVVLDSRFSSYNRTPRPRRQAEPQPPRTQEPQTTP